MATLRGFTAKQGQYDGLCGLYSIVNSISLLSKGTVDGEALMKSLVKSLDAKNQFTHCFQNGATRHRMRQLLKATNDHCKNSNNFTLKWTFHLGADLELERFWAMMNGHQSIAGDGSIILGLSGKHVHWSCIHRVGPKALIMADCGNENKIPLARVNRKFCDTSEMSSSKPYILEEAFFLELSERA